MPHVIPCGPDGYYYVPTGYSLSSDDVLWYVIVLAARGADKRTTQQLQGVYSMKIAAVCTTMFAFALFLTPLAHSAELSFSRHHSDNMVLQREKPVLIRGFADK